MPCRLEAARVERGVSKEAIIRETGLSKPTVYAVLRGEKVSLGSLLRVAAALDVPASEISEDAATIVAKVG